MNIDFELAKVGIKQVTIFYYNVGYCLFDAITYLLRYSNSSINIPKKLYVYFCLNIGTSKILQCHEDELTFDFLHIYIMGKQIMQKITFKKCQC